MQDSRASALHGVLALLAADKQLENRIRLQKEAYLLALKGYANFQPRKFIFHYFGPYSREVSDALHLGVSSELIQEKKEAFGGKSKYTYVITDEGRRWLESESDDGDEMVFQLHKQFRSAHWRCLELAATAAFLERSGAAEARDESIAKAVALKPECKPFQADAQKLLHSLSL